MNSIEVKYGKWCVYAHEVDGKVVYVGKGKNGRAFELSTKRRPEHMRLLSLGRIVVVILGWFDTSDEALAFEWERIAVLQPPANLTRVGYTAQGAPVSATLFHVKQSENVVLDD